jgi:hypothetical protein
MNLLYNNILRGYMSITIFGGRKSQRELLLDMSYWLGNELLGERMLKNLTIDVTLRKFSDIDESDYNGYVEVEDSHIKPRHFSIHIHKFMDEDMIMETLAHEMVHVKQDVKGETKERYRGGFKMYWKGEDHTETPYRKQPWEKEAFKLEKRLVKKYLKSL